MLNYWYRIIGELPLNTEGSTKLDFTDIDIPKIFFDSLLDDLNTPLAIKLINDFAKEFHKTDDYKVKIAAAKKMMYCAQFLGLIRLDCNNWFKGDLDHNSIAQLIQQRTNAKKLKNWQLADQIRSNVLELGIAIEDKHDGTTIWKKVNKG
jgi:cysteinyl-tRNA synthetase